MDRFAPFIRRWLPLGRTVAALLLVAMAGWVGCAPSQSSQRASDSQAASPTPARAALPGAAIWNDGASSFVFGTNDTYEWSERNIETDPAIQRALHDAGITLVRTFIPDNANDATIEQRIDTIEHIGAKCLAVLTNVNNTAFNQHVVSYLGNRCQLYEFGNEPDYSNIPFDQYMSAWNKTIPLLRHINPSAKFIGPVVSNSSGVNNFMLRYLQGVKASGVLPDAISFHYYPCWQMDEATCLASASTYTSAVQQVRGLVKTTLGKDVPVGVTEWNYDPGNPPPAYGDKADFITKFTQAAIKAIIAGGAAFACQFDAASYSGYGRLDMFDVNTGQPKPQFNALAALIKQYKPATDGSTGMPVPPSGQALLSRDATAVCTANNSGPGGPQALLDGKFGNWGFWQIATNAMPGSCAIHLKTNARNVILAWFSDYSFDLVDPTSLAPQDYDIAVSGDSTNGRDGSWRTVAQVRGNHARAREHRFDFTGMSWIRMIALKGQPEASQPYMRIDEIEVFDTHNLGANTFFFSGDSITAISYNRYAENLPSFADNMQRCAPQQYPLMINGGFGGQSLDGVVGEFTTWQTMFPDMRYWLLGWGTNDALNNESPEVFQQRLQTAVTVILQNGHVPILAHIPYATYRGGPSDLDAEIQRLNAAIDAVTAANHLIPGPDLYALVSAHHEYLGPDGIHPNGAGAVAINKLWFQTLRSHLGLSGANCG
ncbi:MAG TPA: GDSL-type esterase/lipase family protein [Ktedonobacterales bacterium]|nr:GDSL-type esterase/lipase family protein [Ktedonobacterales bacterium]